MDKFFDRLGLYDFWGVVFPGLIVTSISYVLYFWGLENQLDIQLLDSFGDTLIFIIISYLLGIILHELSRRFSKAVIYKNGKPKETFLTQNIHIFSDRERDLVMLAINKCLDKQEFKNTPEDATFIYTYCKTYLRVNGMMESLDRNTSLLGINKSLFSFFAFYSILFPICVLIRIFNMLEFHMLNALLGEAFLLISTSVFLRRARQFSEMKVTSTLRIFYTDVLLKTQN